MPNPRLRHLKAWSFDPFEKDTGWHTARLDDPMRLHWENGERLGGGYLLGRNPNWSHREKPSQKELEDPEADGGPRAPMWHSGICEDAKAAGDWIFNSFGDRA